MIKKQLETINNDQETIRNNQKQLEAIKVIKN